MIAIWNTRGSSNGNWTMTDELGFIVGLGTWVNRSSTISASQKLALLRGYRQGLELRTLMTNLNRQELLNKVDAEIARVSALPPDTIL